jgi:hypothetical protein
VGCSLVTVFLKVGDVRLVEPNFHASTKHLDQLMMKFFPDAKFDEDTTVRARRFKKWHIRVPDFQVQALGSGVWFRRRDSTPHDPPRCKQSGEKHKISWITGLRAG